jgi:pimeloyl-ACP methyl ester carboxylesterase
MLRSAVRTLRYARSWKQGSGVQLQEIEIERDGLALPTTFATPASHRGRLPGWIVLGGVTHMGRFHPQLTKFVNALAGSGAAAIVPDTPEWRNLRLDTGLTVPTIRGAIRALDARPEVDHGRYGLIGLSFGAPQVVIASRHPELADRIAGVVSFGGYCDLERTLRCQLTGLHEWRGVTERIEPDPYGLWVPASNYLTGVPGLEDAGNVAEALRTLALASTTRRIPAWDPAHDELKRELRAALPPERRVLFDLCVRPAATPVRPTPEGEALAVAIAAAGRRHSPLVDPAVELSRVTHPVHILHGRGDRLVPYTESLRLRELLPQSVDRQCTITGLFAHTANARPATITDQVREGAILFRGLQRMLALVS